LHRKADVPIGSHDDFDVSPGVESVQLIDQLQHCPLHFIVSAFAIVETGSADSIDFVEKDDAGLFGSSHFEQLAHHAGTFTNVLLHQLGADYYLSAGAVSQGRHLPRMNVLSVRLATALAQRVLPVPGGP
jgi:hypothetical protein